jgi:hypothetical protein
VAKKSTPSAPRYYRPERFPFAALGNVAGVHRLPDGCLLLSLMGPDGTNSDVLRQTQPRQQAAQQLENADRCAALAEVQRQLAGDAAALASARELADQLPRESEKLNLLEEEWLSRLKRLQLDKDTPHAALTEAENAVSGIQDSLDELQRQITRAEEEVAAIEAKRRRTATEIAGRVIEATRERLRQQRVDLLQTLCEKISSELAELEHVELCLSLGRRSELAQTLADEALEALKTAGV